MKGFQILLCLSIFSQSALALSPLQKDRFQAELEVRRLEEKIALQSGREDLEAGAKSEELRKLSALLTQAKIEKNGVLDEQKASRAPASVTAEDRESLLSAPRARPTFDWQVYTEQFGRAAGDELLRHIFGQADLPFPTHSNELVLWITTPSFPILSRAEAEKAKQAREKATKDLARLGYKVEMVSPGPFIHLDDLAEDLQKILRARFASGPALLISEHNASAVLMRMFDNYPEFLRKNEVLGWLNVNGRLYGQAQDTGRKPASTTIKQSAADRQHQELRQEELRLRLERLEKEAPLGAAFPVINLVTIGGADRPAENLRESIVPEARTHFLESGSGLAKLGAALQALKHP